MIDRPHRLLLLGVGLLALGWQGCASGGGSSVSAWRPGLGGWPGTGVQANRARTWNGPLVQPGTGLQPTPAMSAPPVIAPGPGPMLPDASGRKFSPFPGAAGIRYPYPQRRMMPPVVPQRGAPIAQQQMPSLQPPAELSGDIEIIPGPSLRARRARMEMLPPPPEENGAP